MWFFPVCASGLRVVCAGGVVLARQASYDNGDSCVELVFYAFGQLTRVIIVSSLLLVAELVIFAELYRAACVSGCGVGGPA